MRNEDAVQVSAVVCGVAEQVQAVSGPGVPELGGNRHHSLCYAALSLTRSEKRHNFTVRMHQIEQKASPPRAQSWRNAQRSHEQLSDAAIVSTRAQFTTMPPLLPHDCAATASILEPAEQDAAVVAQRGEPGRESLLERRWGGHFPRRRRRPAAAGGRHGCGQRGEEGGGEEEQRRSRGEINHFDSAGL